MFEKIGTFNGYYHVINGLISPLDGVNPEDIGLNKLLDRLNSGNFKSLELYVSAYAIDSNIGNRTELIFFLICNKVFYLFWCRAVNFCLALFEKKIVCISVSYNLVNLLFRIWN